ncbi:MAG: [protein-PII] uridylyltransferase [Melioribacteraceae bacterium]|nr:[protein-PII] uridylyltransferase [Melioribacteraceae bacterium]
MPDYLQIKQEFAAAKEEIFKDKRLLENAYEFCVQFSLLVEEYLIRIANDFDLNCALVSSGSFSRRELSPHSDIDVLFIFERFDGGEESIQKCITALWDCGIEVSHTVREFNDIQKFLETDLHAFTQFFETRFIIGSEKIYNEWNSKLLSLLNKEIVKKLVLAFFEDVETRYKKYGDSPKVLEPNIKYSAGGLRDLQMVQWMYSLKNNVIITDQSERTQTEIFIDILREKKLISPIEINRIYRSYELLLKTRNLLHLICSKKNDRLEFHNQEQLAKHLDQFSNNWEMFMKQYFEAATKIHRFSKTILKRYHEQLVQQISDRLAIELDEEFMLKGNLISRTVESELTLSSILRAFYYRCLHDARFDEQLRSAVIEKVAYLDEDNEDHQASSVFFREILKSHSGVGKTLTSMNEMGVLQLFLPEFKDLIGFFQPGVYHCYTADEHTLIALSKLENLPEDGRSISKLFHSLKDRDIIYLAVLFHDIAKPISVSGHEIIGAEIASSIMERIGYEADEIATVKHLVRHHLTMEQVAFRRNLNDPATLNKFATLFPSIHTLDLLYLLTYADLSAVSPVVWTEWKSDLLFELYQKTRTMLEERLSGEELLVASKEEILSRKKKEYSSNVQKHIESIDDIGYLNIYSQEEINEHVKQIENGEHISVFFKENGGYTNVTVITKDSSSLLSKLCGALSINDLNIHDANIFTRNDGIVIDSFNVTDYRTQKKVEEARYEKITIDLTLAVENELAIGTAFKKIESKWRRFENKLFNIASKIKIEFERHEKYTIIDVYAPDKLGLLYQVTKRMNELGLAIFFAKIATKGDDVVDAFYVLNNKGNKIPQNDYELIKMELKEAIEELI